MSRNRLYRSLGSLLIIAYAYVVWSLSHASSRKGIVFCPFKNITGIACPSCGTTRSVMALAKGHFYEAVIINPLGILAAFIMVAAPLWLLYDIILKKDTLHTRYYKTEHFINNNRIIIVFTGLLMITNWIWNIYKGL